MPSEERHGNAWNRHGKPGKPVKDIDLACALFARTG